MLRSMTGFGEASAELPEARLSIEVRSVNHRFANVKLRLPTGLGPSERMLHGHVAKQVRRGRAEVVISVEHGDGTQQRPALNRPLLEEALAAARAVAEEYDLDERIRTRELLALPGMFRNEEVRLEWNEGQRKLLLETLARALAVLDEDRRREGGRIGQELGQRLRAMQDCRKRLEHRAAALPNLLRQRLIERVGGELRAAEIRFDQGRLEQEAVLLADRCDVTEELVRLSGHLDQATHLLTPAEDEPVGKRLDFLLQEIHRETNTICSKSTDLELTRAALELKVETEKVREQVQNLE